MSMYYSGTQWTVTEYGIEQRDGYYHIPRRDFDQAMGEGGWVGHMAEKNWVDIEDFKKAYSIATTPNPGVPKP